jgi:glycosyltransferase involved in cell wall biosynthesis
MKPRPSISIILPVYNGELTLGKTIMSVQLQNFFAWELLIIDDGSIDATAEVAKQFCQNDERIVYIKNESNLGIQKSLNIGAQKAVGKYLARIDADDTWCVAEKLSEQYAYMEAHTETVLTGTNARIVDAQTKKILLETKLPLRSRKIYKRMLFSNNFIHSSVIIRASTFREVGGYSESPNWRHVEDYELWLRLGEKGKLVNLRTSTVEVLVATTSISSTHKLIQMKKLITLVQRFGYSYPYFLCAYFFAVARYLTFLLMYRFLNRGGFVYRLFKRL